MIRYRNIYKKHYGFIPYDADGRTYDIHHIDGKRNNNAIENLIALTVQEHYDVHYSQGDWYACLLISRDMKITPQEKSRLSSKANKKRVKEGSHNFLDKKAASRWNKQRVADGTHNLLSGEIQRRDANKRVSDGTHHLLGGKIQRQLVTEGKHHLLGGSIQRKVTKRLREEGKHNSCVIHTCPKCGKEGKGPGMYNHLKVCKGEVV